MDTSKFHTTTKNGNSVIITAFDYSSLQSFAGCLTDIGKTLFQNGDQWIDRRTLYEAVKCFSAYAGFAPNKQTNSMIKCRCGFMCLHYSALATDVVLPTRVP